MRIIAGEWRGRRFEAPPTMDVRPTADRVRESWMSILQREIPEARVLDVLMAAAGVQSTGTMLAVSSRGSVAGLVRPLVRQ